MDAGTARPGHVAGDPCGHALQARLRVPRARSKLSPQIQPMIPTPGHASLAERPCDGGLPVCALPAGLATRMASKYHEQLQRLAARIAVNRTVGGPALPGRQRRRTACWARRWRDFFVARCTGGKCTTAGSTAPSSMAPTVRPIDFDPRVSMADDQSGYYELFAPDAMLRPAPLLRSCGKRPPTNGSPEVGRPWTGLHCPRANLPASTGPTRANVRLRSLPRLGGGRQLRRLRLAALPSGCRCSSNSRRASASRNWRQRRPPEVALRAAGVHLERRTHGPALLHRPGQARFLQAFRAGGKLARPGAAVRAWPCRLGHHDG